MSEDTRLTAYLKIKPELAERQLIVYNADVNVLTDESGSKQ